MNAQMGSPHEDRDKSAFPTPLISTEWAARQFRQPGADDLPVKFVDASWRLPTASNKDGSFEEGAKAAYDRAHIPGAVFFDLDKIADATSPLPHMLPSREKFESAVGAMGLTAKDTIIVYDEAGIFSAARVWWTFRIFGHRNVSVLNGGLPKWRAEGLPLDDQAEEPQTVPYNTVHPISRHPKSRTDDFFSTASRQDVADAIATRDRLIIDARPQARFDGTAPEPRAGLRSGAMPGAINLPYTEILNEDGTLKDDRTLSGLFAVFGDAQNKPVIATCGSGVTAAIIILALEKIGRRDHALYDGAWADWGDIANSEICPVVRVGG